MNLQLTGPASNLLQAEIEITGSKSESNRLLLLQAIYPNLQIQNISNSDDAKAMKEGLAKRHGKVDIHHAGTAMRFLTAFFASREEREIVLTGSSRMQERPIKILVEALRQLGAEINYVHQEGYPPLKINGRQLKGSGVSLPANISSQYISALLLIAPGMENGLEVELIGEVTSIPYIKMTLSLLDALGIENSFRGNRIKVMPRQTVHDTTIVVESDWSSASYYYGIAALSEIGTKINLTAYKKNSLQGDSILSELYRDFGVTTSFGDHSISLLKTADHKTSVEYDLTSAPDIAQTIVVSCFGLGMGCHLSGLHTLKIKETDRLEALYKELTKLGAKLEVTSDSLTLEPGKTILSKIAIDTYNDHRMAMAFAPLAMKTTLIINDAEVVSKSYPDFWEDLKRLEFVIQDC
ncbi:MAG: 3-phosphoshikimate 1-carboxyvinyltransferase [Eudoraea sp.]|nr:3-phosphoshikimate 1-carboxyvinyltransferase [Eudoraea sp.]